VKTRGATAWRSRRRKKDRDERPAVAVRAVIEGERVRLKPHRQKWATWCVFRTLLSHAV